MSPLAIAAIVVAVIIVLLIVALVVVPALTGDGDKNAADPLAGQPGHDHSNGAANCPACQAASKPVNKKIPLKCMVQLRPPDTWNGEYGFDWLRIGGAGEMAGEEVYKDIIIGGVKATGIVGGKTAVTQEYTHTIVPPETVSTEDYLALKKEYKTIDTEIKSAPQDLKEYFVPYLNLFPKGTAGTPTPPFEAELKVIITIAIDDVDKIEMEYATEDKKYFELKYDFKDKAKTTKKASADTVKITCLKEFSSDQEIDIKAYPKGWKAKSDATLAGRIIVCRNDASMRKELKFVLVKVKTKITTIENSGSFTASDKDNLTNSLFQALIIATMEDGPDLDLTADAKFKIVTNAGGTKTYGNFIYKKTSAADTNNDGGIYEDAPGSAMFKYLQTLFLNKPGNEKYKTGKYFTVFSINELTYDPGTIGQIESVGVHNLVLFPGRKVTTCAHEGLHGLGLQHTHKDGALEPERKYIFIKRKTDNVISYADTRKSTWRWQWDILRANV